MTDQHLAATDTPDWTDAAKPHDPRPDPPGASVTRPTTDQLEQLIADLRPVLADADRITRQMLDWAADAVKGIDTSKVRVGGGSISNPVEAEALRRLDGQPDIWRIRASRFRGLTRWCAVELAVGVTDDRSEFFASRARETLDLARLTHTPPPVDRETTARLIEENSTTGVCEWCKHDCRGARSIGIDGRIVDDRRRRVVCSDRWSIGLCNACHIFLRRRIPAGVALSDSAHHETISAELLDGTHPEIELISLELLEQIRKERDIDLSRRAQPANERNQT